MNDALMVDLSSNNERPDLRAHYAAGRRLLGLKATEGADYRWTGGLDLADQWHRLGGAVVWYHFATAHAPGPQQAEHFYATIRPHLARRDVVCLDLEPQPPAYPQWQPHQSAATGAAFMSRLSRLAGRRRRRWLYGPASFLADLKPTPLPGWRAWVAAYQATPPAPPAGWQLAAWQYTDRAANVPGVPGLVDQSQVTRRHIARPLRPKRQQEAADLTRALNHRHHPADSGARRQLRRLAAAIRKALHR